MEIPKGLLAHPKYCITDTLLNDLGSQNKPPNLSEEEYKAWEILEILMNTHSKNLANRFNRWFSSDTAQIQHLLAKYEDKHSGDPWAAVLILLSCRKVTQASKIAQELGDHDLASLLVESEKLNVRQNAQGKVKQLQLRGTFKELTGCHQKIWCALGGQLGYCAVTETVIVEDMDWMLVLGLHVWNGTCASQTLYHAIQLYNEALAYLPGIHNILSRKKTALPPSNCLWVGVLRLWASNMPNMAATKERKKRRSTDWNTLSVDEWPLHFVWLLTLLRSDWFSSDEIYQCTRRWCNALCEVGLAEESVFSALFLKDEASREALIKTILNSRELKNEGYILNELYIPRSWLYQAKATRAHLAKDYATEADYYFEANQFSKAKYTIINHLIPAHMFNNENGLVSRYLSKLDLYGDKDNEGDILLNSYKLIESLPKKIDTAVDDPEATKLLKDDIHFTIKSLKEVQASCAHEDNLVFFIHRICGNLLKLAAGFNDHVFLEELITATPLTPEDCQLNIKEFSRCFLTSFINQACI
ncbi:nuclear protein 96-domain-containing protein [Phycomyces blakesleeanus]